MDKPDYELTDTVRESVMNAAKYFADAAANLPQSPPTTGLHPSHVELSEQLLAKMNADVFLAKQTFDALLAKTNPDV